MVTEFRQDQRHVVPASECCDFCGEDGRGRRIVVSGRKTFVCFECLSMPVCEQSTSVSTCRACVEVRLVFRIDGQRPALCIACRGALLAGTGRLEGARSSA